MNAETAAESGSNSADRQRLRRRLFAVIPLLAILACVYAFFFAGRFITTDNAYVKADVLNLSAEVAGKVVEVLAIENQHVSAGDLLLRVDASSYEVEVQDAEAALQKAYINVASLRASYLQGQAALAAARDDLVYATKQQVRIEGLHHQGVASSQQRDQAQRDLDVAQNRVNELDSQQAETVARLGGRADVDIDRHPDVLEARAELAKAEIALSRCELRAPIDGVVAKVPQRGHFAMTGIPLISVVSDQNVWVEANFKEDQLKDLRPGAQVDLTLDAYPGEHWNARVDSIAQATGAEFALLPPQNATGNWVKVVQRLTVRLEIEHHVDESPLRAGLSADVSVDTGVPGRLKRFASLFGHRLAAESADYFASHP